MYASGLDWAIVCPFAFVEGKARKRTRKIVRADIVKFLTRKLDETGCKRKAAGISH